MRRLVVIAAFGVVLPAAAAAHGLRSAYLEITELDGGRASLRLSTNAPSAGLHLLAPSGCRAETDPESSPFVVACDGGLAGRELRIEGLGPIVGDAAVRVTFRDGATASHVLSSGAPSWTLPRKTGAAAVMAGYARMGVVHIFSGVDHLLFLAALALALGKLRAILVAETAFTASHTLTFTASALGWIHVSAAAAEACIALSLVLIALDAAAARSVSTRRAALLAFGFGLVHGLGFAGGLAEIGLPDRAIGFALAGFAGGVEAGQVVFLVAFVALLSLAARVQHLRHVPVTLAYAVGSAGAFLFLQRLVAVLHRGGFA